MSEMPNKYKKICDRYLHQEKQCINIYKKTKQVNSHCELVNTLYKNCLDYQRNKMKSIDQNQ